MHPSALRERRGSPLKPGLNRGNTAVLPVLRGASLPGHWANASTRGPAVGSSSAAASAVREGSPDKAGVRAAAKDLERLQERREELALSHVAER
jgi:hypothetical protein